MAIKNKFPAVDLLRFLAALMVVALHLVASNTVGHEWHVYVPHSENIRPYYSHIGQFWFTGFVGVQIFFSISGYIISLSAESSRSPFAFVKGRLLRLLPALWICTAVALLIEWTFATFPSNELISRAVRSFLLLPFGPYVDGVIWTIIVELAFYFLVFVFILFQEVKRLHLIGYGLIVASSAFWLSLYAWPELATSHAAMQLARRLLLEHGIFFGVGVLLSPRTSSNENQLLSAGMLIIALPAAYLQIQQSVSFLYGTYQGSGASNSAIMPFGLWIFSLLILFISSILVEKGMIKTDFAQVRKVGLATYPLYLLHFTCGHMSFALLYSMTGLPAYLCTILALAIVLALSFIVALYIEPIAKNALKLMLDRIFVSFEKPAYRTSAAARDS